MRIRRVFGFASLALLVVIAFISCSLLGTSIDTRINQFVSSLNGDRTQTYKQLVPNSGPYNANNGITTLWDIQFPSADGPFSFTYISSSPYNANDTEVTINFPGASLTKQYKFVLQQVGLDYYIASLYVNSSGWVLVF
jgi:hypothetical protein